MADLIRWARDRKKELEDIASKSWDQLNPLDNGRTWEQRTPTNSRSVNQQLYENGVNNQVGKPLWQTGVKTGNTLRAANAGVIGAIDAGMESIAGSDLSYQKALDRTMAAMDAPLQRGAFLTPKQARSQGTGWKGLKEDFIDPTAQGVAEIAPIVVPAGGLAKGLSLLPRVGVNAAAGAAVSGGADATSQLVNTGKIDTEQLLKSALIGGTVAGAFPVVGAGARGAKTALAKAKPLDEAGSLPGNNLNLNIDDFKARKAQESGAPPPPDLTTQVAKLSDAQMIDQMTTNLGLSKSVAQKLVAENNKPALFQNLYGSKDYIRAADSPDAYAVKVMGEANKRGQAALNQNAPSKPAIAPVQASDGNMVNPLTGEIVDAPAPKLDTPSTFITKLEEAKLAATKEIESIDNQIKQQGIDPNELRQKMTLANRKEYKLTEPEQIAAAQYTARLDQARGRLEDAGYSFEGSQDFYTPQVKKGESRLPSTREELSDFGYSNTRENKLGIDEIDYGKTPQIDYLVKAENRSLLIQKAVDDAAKVDGRVVPEENVVAAAGKIEELQKKVQDKSKSESVLKNNTTDELNEIGKLEGYTQITNDYEPRMITQEPKVMLEKAGIYKRGFEQFENAAGYGNEFAILVRDSKLSGDDVFKALEADIKKVMPDAEPSSIASAIAGAKRTMEYHGIDPLEANGIYISAYRNAAKSELFRLGKTTEFTGNKMNQVVNEQINYRLMQDAYQKNGIQKIDSFLAERFNVSLRGANIVSALFEMGDYFNVMSKYGLDDVLASKGGINKINGDSLFFSKKYGQSQANYLSPDLSQVSKMDKIWANPKTSVRSKVWQSYRAVENKVLFFRYIEQHKTEMFFRAAEADYVKKGFTGTKLVDAVMEDYYKTMLPHSMLTANRLIGKFPRVTTQYLNWSVQATKRLGRTISGSDEGGRFSKMNRGERIVSGTMTELVPKITTAALLGVPIMQILGMRDFTGATTGDFTGISEEEKKLADHIVEGLSLSPALSVPASYYFADRRNEIADKRKAAGETYNIERKPEDTVAEVTKKNARMLIPFNTQANKTAQVLDATSTDLPDVKLPQANVYGMQIGGQNLTGQNRGYFENKQGRVQTEGPSGASLVTGIISGKSYTPQFKEYQDNPDLMSFIKGRNPKVGQAKPLVGEALNLIKKNQSVSNLVQAVGGEATRDFKRPLSDDYSTAYKQADKELQVALLDGGRKWNGAIDNLKKTDRNAYNRYIESMENHVSPEFWRKVTGGTAANDQDLTIFKMMGDRKKQLYADMSKAGMNTNKKYDYDPIYDLPENQARQVLQMKATGTGEDLALRNILYKEQWFKDYKAKEREFYDKKPAGDAEEFKQTARVKEWNTYNDTYNELTGIKGDTLKKNYPLVWQLKQFEFGSQQSKDFLRANYDAWKAQSDALDKEQLVVINKMRGIEGLKDMSLEAYAQATHVEDTDGKDDKKYYARRSGSGSGGGSDNIDYTLPKISDGSKLTPKGVSVKKLSSPNFKAKTKKLSVKNIPGSYTSRKLG